jgi:hypothetical protein
MAKFLNCGNFKRFCGTEAIEINYHKKKQSAHKNITFVRTIFFYLKMTAILQQSSVANRLQDVYLC